VPPIGQLRRGRRIMPTQAEYETDFVGVGRLRVSVWWCVTAMASPPRHPDGHGIGLLSHPILTVPLCLWDASTLCDSITEMSASRCSGPCHRDVVVVVVGSSTFTPSPSRPLNKDRDAIGALLGGSGWRPYRGPSFIVSTGPYPTVTGTRGWWRH
jgi:hypothetical protein